MYLFESRKNLMVGGFEDLTSASWCNMTLWKVLYNSFFFKELKCFINTVLRAKVQEVSYHTGFMF